MRRALLIGLTLALIAGGALLAAQAPGAALQLKAAQQKEEVQGDLQGAIELYKKLARAPDRAVAATALVRMAGCYQKLGDVEAQKIYERVIRDFTDQPEVVRLARARLATDPGRPSSSGIVRRQVWTGPQVDLKGSVSLDGRYLSFVDWDTGDLAIRDLTAGTNRRLTAKGTWRDSNDYAQESVISPDGRLLAYAWFTANELRYSLRVIALAPGASDPRVLVAQDDIDWIGPYAWSPDGKWIAVQLKRPDHTAQIGLVNAGDGALRVLKSVDWRGSTKVLFSPDGRYLAFDVPAGDDGPHDVFVMAVDGSREMRVAPHPANDLTLGWTPDGQHLLFESDRSGSMGVWALGFENGRPAGVPQLLKSDIGDAQAVGMTRTGALYLGAGTSGAQLYAASIDFDSGTVLTPPTLVGARFVFDDRQPVWSPDGTELAFLSFQSGLARVAGGTAVLTIRSVRTGQMRELRPQLAQFNFPRWSPDGRSFVAQGTDLKGRNGIYRFDAQSGEALAVAQAAGFADRLSSPDWMSDGRSIVYQHTPADIAQRMSGENILVQRDLASGIEREIMRGAPGNPGFVPRVAPDGQSVATVVSDDAGRETALLVVSTVDGHRRELLRVREPERIDSSIAWTPDGRYIVFGKAVPPAVEFSRIPAIGGEPRRIDLKLADGGQPTQPAVHPDGRQMVFMVSRGVKSELWTLENFLPVSSAKK